VRVRRTLQFEPELLRDGCACLLVIEPNHAHAHDMLDANCRWSAPIRSGPMRILVVSDLHYTLKQLDWVTSSASDYDLVVIAGDLLDISSLVAPDAQIAMVLEYLARVAATTQLVVCSGNHDLDDVNALDERAAVWLERAVDAGVVVDGARLDTEHLLVTVCAYWDGPLSQAQVGEQLAADQELVGDRLWIWAYHAPPDNSRTSWTGKRYYGDDVLNAWIERYSPAVVLCGHVHTSPFVDGGGWHDRIGSTLVLNAGTQIGPVPTHIELDTDVGVARWRSFDGSGEIALDAVSTPGPGHALIAESVPDPGSA
jgi:Icc-related predicted phosphoesterase